jgi:hypothetical protein
MDTAQIEQQLDALHGRHWDLYRLAAGGWAVRLEGGTATGPTIGEALRQALTYTPPVPPRPRPLHAFEFEARKDGAKWRLYLGGESICGAFPTKRQAEAHAARMIEASERSCAEWDAKYATT